MPLRTDLTDSRITCVFGRQGARVLLQRLLEVCDVTVRTAGTAEEALALIRAEQPHVLVSDIGMPGQDGYELILQVRALSPSAGGNTPAVALTAYARPEDRVAAIAAGFQHHLSKPVEPTELVAIVQSLVRRSIRT